MIADAQKAANNATGLSPFGGGLNVSYPDFTAKVFEPEYNKMFLGKSSPEDFIQTLVTKTKEYWASKG